MADTKPKCYLYGEDNRDSNFYLIYTPKDHSFHKLKESMKSLEGVFVSNIDLRNELGTSIVTCKKNKTEDFEEQYKGKFHPFEK
jgi:hypothetical protein